MAPFNQLLHPHTLVYVAVFFAIGLAFGAVLEMSGFGDSRRLAAQFYLRDMTVLKVMFTAIIVAGVLIHLASSLELLDIRRIWINPTYLASGIVGGLIMGVGFILGGFCPGTSLVAAATLKLDGIFFVLGALVGVFAFGRTVPEFEPFFHAGFLGRYTIGDWLGVPIGVALVLVVGLALAMFYGAEVSEAVFGRRRSWRTVSLFPKSRALASGVVALGLVSAAVVLLGQPGTSDRWDWISRKGGDQLASRSVFVDPREVVDLRRDLSVRVRILDLRDETDYNLFHIDGAELADPETVDLPPLLANLLAVPDNTVIFLASNGEAVAREAWKRLRAQGVINLYVIEGGINHWLDVYPPDPSIATRWSPSREGSGSALQAGDAGAPATPALAMRPTPARRASRDGNRLSTPVIVDEPLLYAFRFAVGERCHSAHPELARREPGAGAWDSATHAQSEEASTDYPRKVQLQRKVVAKGGCG